MQIFRTLLFFFLYSMIFIYAMAFTNASGWALLVAMTLFLIMSLIGRLGPLKKVTIKNLDDFPLHVGQTAPVTFVMQKKVSYPVFFWQLQMFDDKQNTIAAWAFYYGQKQSFKQIWTPDKRGLEHPFEFTLLTGDPFGWLIKRQRLVMTAERLVLPAIHPQAAAFRRFIQKEQKQQFFGTPSYDIKNYRPYRLGDPLKQMDWKLSSRLQQLILREYQTYQEVATLLAFYGQDSPYFEEMLSFFYSLQKGWHQTGIEVLLIGKTGRIFQPTDLDFAKIEPFTQTPALPAFSQAQVWLFTPQKLGLIHPNPFLRVYDHTDLLRFERTGFYD